MPSSVDSANKWKVTSKYDAGGAPGQVDLHEGELVEKLTADVNGWPKVRKSDGTEGHVPARFLGNIYK